MIPMPVRYRHLEGGWRKADLLGFSCSRGVPVAILTDGDGTLFTAGFEEVCVK